MVRRMKEKRVGAMVEIAMGIPARKPVGVRITGTEKVFVLRQQTNEHVDGSAERLAPAMELPAVLAEEHVGGAQGIASAAVGEFDV